MWLKQFKLWKIPTMVVCVQMHCALLHSVCYLKVAQVDMQCSLISELILYKFKLSNNAMEATIKTHCEKGSVDHCTGTKWFKKFRSGCKKLNDQVKSGRPKNVNSEAVQIWGVALGEYQRAWYLTINCGFIIFTNLAKAFWAIKLCLTLPKYCITFDLLLYYSA